MRDLMKIRNDKFRKAAGKIGAVLLAFCLSAAMALPAQADTDPDEKVRASSVNVTFQTDKSELEGTSVNLYKIAEFTSDAAAYTLSDPYAGELGSPTFDGSDEARLAAGAQTLVPIVRADGISPDQSSQVSGGKAYFESLPAGLYLVTYDLPSDCGYNAGAILQSFPYDFEGNDYVSDITIDIKVSTVETQQTKYRVQKVWKGDSEKDRPDSITVVILKDGREYDRQQLSSSNNWSCSWEYDGSAVFSVKEESVPEGYSVRVTQNGTEFSVTNTRSGQTTSKPGSAGIKTGDNSALMLWIILLCGGGLAMVIFGIRFAGKNRKE